MRERSGSDVAVAERTNMVTPGYDQTSQPGGAVVASGGVQDAALGVAASQPIIPPHDGQYQDQAQFECDKRAVYKHPLFPLLALLFEKCEMATRTASESPFSDSFHHDLEAFVQHQERDRKPFLANDPEVDGLMIKAIQVLRIHLLELDKVQELCKDFCNRYIACLKGKMQSENLLRSDYFDSSGGGSGGGGFGGGASLSSNSNSPHHSFSSNGDVSVSPPMHNNNNGPVFLHHNNTNQQYGHHQVTSPPQFPPHDTSSPAADHGGGDSTTTSSSVSPPIGIVHGGTPLSQIGANTCAPPQQGSEQSFVQSHCDTPPTPSSSVDDDEDYLGGGGSGRKKPKRGVLPKHATSIMRSWLFQHIVHPYPTEDEKRQIAAQTNLTLLQVNNWFINARRRILQPMLDASNPETPAPPKVKKMKTNGSKPALKYWSDNMHSGLQSGGNGTDENDLEDNESGDESDESSNDPHDLLIDNSDSSQQ
ncbi:Homeobox protein PKNOX2 [Orchesella cincta]|uniref:Homeobox protein PKNOX2 n=1 Tax=Orchesella cincta TaxID=48709 RepID=A0A1D2MPX9_ORCCI|nr:Homeobox protein PKNOX2 [Orchesella cincta]